MSRDSHAREGDRLWCPPWCVGRLGGRHDVDDLYGPAGVHHDSPLLVANLGGPGDDGSRLYVKASQFAPHVGVRWPALVEVDAALSPARRRGGPGSLWLHPGEAVRVAAMLGVAAGLAALATV